MTPGYEGNPEANEKNFFMADGVRWFRTGDQGSFDEDGYLQLTGRLKEIINRGGEKISPREVDEVLMGNVLPAGLGQAPARQAALVTCARKRRRARQAERPASLA